MDIIIDTSGDFGNTSEIAKTPAKCSLIEELLKTYHESVDEKPLNSSKRGNQKFSKSTEQLSAGLTLKTKKAVGLLKGNKSDSVTEMLNKVYGKSDVLKAEFETQHSVPDYNISDKRLKEERRKERERTKGGKWFGMKAAEMSDEMKRDLEVLQMRSVLDPKRFYKKNDIKVLPKYFQVGQVMDSPLDYYKGRLTKKERKKTLVDELLADAEFNKYNKQKYAEIITQKQKTHYKAWKQAKKLKKKNK